MLAMEPPLPTYPDSVRDEKVKLFRAIRPVSPQDLVRGQYAGYREEKGVAPDSTVETFAARAAADGFVALGRRAVLHPRRQAAGQSCTEVLVTLKRPPLRRMGPEDGEPPALPAQPRRDHRDRRAREEAGRPDGLRADRAAPRASPGRDVMLPYERLLEGNDGGDTFAVRARGQRRARACLEHQKRPIVPHAFRALHRIFRASQLPYGTRQYGALLHLLIRIYRGICPECRTFCTDSPLHAPTSFIR